VARPELSVLGIERDSGIGAALRGQPQAGQERSSSLVLNAVQELVKRMLEADIDTRRWLI